MTKRIRMSLLCFLCAASLGFLPSCGKEEKGGEDKAASEDVLNEKLPLAYERGFDSRYSLNLAFAFALTPLSEENKNVQDRELLFNISFVDHQARQEASFFSIQKGESVLFSRFESLMKKIRESGFMEIEQPDDEFWTDSKSDMPTFRDRENRKMIVNNSRVLLATLNGKESHLLVKAGEDIPTPFLRAEAAIREFVFDIISEDEIKDEDEASRALFMKLKQLL